MSFIKIENVSFLYELDEGTLKALNNVSLEINEGEFLAIVGHNGSGKSTLAKLLNALLLPSNNGKVLVNGMNTKDEKKLFEIRKTVGMVFQNPDNQMVASIIEDDLAFGPENIGVPREEIEQRITWALEAVGMTEHRYGTPFKLSGGQKQRIAIAGILTMLPKVLVLDESTAMLDPQGRRSVMETIRKLNKEKNITIVLITHFMDEAAAADRIVVVNDGKIILDGKPDYVFTKTETIKEAGLELPIPSQIAYDLIGSRGLTEKNIPLTCDELVQSLLAVYGLSQKEEK